jgi:eukaryotic-like serine/threonine-protein kinase
MPVASPSHALPPFLKRPEEERRLGPFLLIRQLGRGGFAPVWLAEESYDGRKLRDVAVKLFFLPDDIAPGTREAQRWREEILDEARALCRVEHPSVVRFYAIHQDDVYGVVGLAMEYAPGRSLDVLVREAGRLDERSVIDVGIDIAWALASVHNAGLVHRDVKPANIIQGASGYKLIDFGIVSADPGVRGLSPTTQRPQIDVDQMSMRAVVTLARDVTPVQASTLGNAPTAVVHAFVATADAAVASVSSPSIGTPTGMPTHELGTRRRDPAAPDEPTAPPLIGTLGYIAPECFEEGARATPASDVYALGVTLFSLLTGALPASVSAGEELPADWYIARGPAPRYDSVLPTRSTVTDPLADLVTLLLDPDPDVRPRYADWIARELELLRDREGRRDSSPPRRSYSTLPPAPKASRGRSGVLFSLLAIQDRAPEPLLPLFNEVERAVAADDHAEAGRALGELGLAALRYTFALGLTLLVAAPAGGPEGRGKGPRRHDALLEQLRSAARPTHSSWCYLLTALHEALTEVCPESAPRFSFAAARGIAEQVGLLLRGLTSQAAVEQGIAWVTALLTAAGPLLASPVRVSRYGPAETTVDVRRLRASAASGTASTASAASAASARTSQPPDAIAMVSGSGPVEDGGAPYVLLEHRWLPLSPFIPLREGRQLLPEAPAAPGKPWRSTDPATGERRDDPALDQAMRRLTGEALDVPRELLEHPPLVGRDEAVGALLRLSEEAHAGGVRVALLTGPLGIGRTRLLDAAVEQSGYAPDRVLRMGCSPERKSPLRPLLRAIEARARGAGPELTLLAGAIDRALSPTGIQRANQAAEGVEGVEDALLLASQEEPLLLAIDDIQWADAHTLELLKLLVERAEVGGAGRLFVVAAARNEPNPGAPLRALLGKVRGKVRAGVRQVALGPLSPEETAWLADAVCPVSPELTRAVVRGSGGVPFFVVHALLVWREKGAIAWREGAWHAVDASVLSEDVPGVADLIEARIASYLDPGSGPGRAALRVLACAALYGGGLGIDAILRAAGDESNAEAALEALVEGGVLTVSGERQEYGFAQEMVRQAVLNLARQRPWFHRLHRALLDAIADGPSARADATFLATGYDKLGAAEPARVWLGRAIEDQIAAGLFGEAAELGDRLAALTADPSARATIDLDIVRALVQGRKFEDAKRRLLQLDARAACAASSPPGVWRRVYRLKVARGLGEPDAADEALLADADAQGDLALRCEARLALACVAPKDHAVPLAGEAVALAERCGPTLEFTARVLRAELNYEASRCDYELARRDLTRALEIARATSSSWQEIHIETDLAVVEAELGQLDAAIVRLRRLADQAEALGMRGQLRLCSQNLSAFLLRAGQNAEAAEAALRTANLASEAGDPLLRAVALSLRSDALRRVGDLEAALASVAEAEVLQRERWDQALTLLRRAEILDGLGRMEEALADARRAQRVAQRFGERGVALTAVLWERLHLAQRGGATREDLERALAEVRASSGAQRAMTRSLVARAAAWLEAEGKGG